MNFVTQCANCQTFFKIVPDQLKLRGGMVRCGVCAESFNALESLHQVPDANATPDAAPTMQDFADASEAEAKALAEAQARREEAQRAEEEERLLPQTITPASKEPQPKTPLAKEPEVTERKPRNVFDRRQHIIGGNAPTGNDKSSNTQNPSVANLLADAEKRSVPVMPAIELPVNERKKGAAAKEVSPAEAAKQPVLDTPISEEEFAPMMRQMKQFTDFGSFDFLDEEDEETLKPKKKSDPKKVAASEKSKPSLKQKMGWMMLGLFMFMLFCTQLIWYFRAAIETSYPNFYYIEEATCEVFGCEVKPVLRKDQVKLMFQQLTPIVSNDPEAAASSAQQFYELKMTFRNSLNIPQQWPSIELQLFNENLGADNQLVPEFTVRRVLRPEEYLPKGHSSLIRAAFEEEIVLPLEINAPYQKFNLHPFYE